MFENGLPRTNNEYYNKEELELIKTLIKAIQKPNSGTPKTYHQQPYLTLALIIALTNLFLHHNFLAFYIIICYNKNLN
jgi:hypothetical protein